jgi:hypothetical protein
MYKILGSDGNEYDALSAEKVRQWIQEGRVEKKTPVMPEDAADWIFLGDLKEFAEVFASERKSAGAGSPGKRWVKPVGLAGLVLLAMGITVFFILKKMKYH